MKDVHLKPLRRFMTAGILIMFAAAFAGCRTWQDSWQPMTVPAGKAWFNERFQQTAFDTNGDGRIDRLRDWMGSGIAKEWHDNDFDGWFDDLIFLGYERESKREHLHLEAPVVPTTGSSGFIELPQ
jgi:hypothetical protein